MAVTNIRGVFGLSDYRKRQLSGLVPEKIRPVFREYGYFAGGLDFPITIGISNVQRLDYSNDTSSTSTRGSLIAARYNTTGQSSRYFGYFFCGAGGVGDTKIDRIDYSNDTFSVFGNRFSNKKRRGASSIGNSEYGYVIGSVPNPGPTDSSVERLSYSNDSANLVFRGNLSEAKGQGLSSSNSNFGYSVGGIGFVGPTSVLRSNIERISFSNDTAVSLKRAELSTYGHEGTESNDFGYYITSNYSNTAIYRLNYSNDTVGVSLRGIFSSFGTGESESSTGNSNFGYIKNNNGVGIERFDLSNDTTNAVSRGKFTISSTRLGATSSASFGGTPNSLFASNYKFPNVNNAGYFSGGDDQNFDNIFTIQKIDYANDTATSSPRSSIPPDFGSEQSGATGNSNFGYIAGGTLDGTSLYSVIRRLDYSNDNAPTSLRGNLSVARNIFQSSAGNANFGYFCGGGTPSGFISNLDRLDYSNDLVDCSVRTTNIILEAKAGTGNQNFGYFGGGQFSSISNIEKIDYSNDTLTPPQSFLVNPVKFHAATGNQSFGYFGGGRGPSPGNTSFIQRIDYSNDTQTSTSRGNLTRGNWRFSATGNNNFGYFGGGNTEGQRVSNVDRINYANDTAIASSRGNFSGGRRYHVGFSPLEYGGAPIYFTNQLPQVLQDQITFDDKNTLELPYKRALGSFGYFAGGNIGPEIQRLDYSNDSANTLTRSNLNAPAIQGAVVGNSNFGYYLHPQGSPIKSAIDRIDYSNDSARPLLRGSAISTGPLRMSGSGNLNFGYFVGDQTNVERFDYSNDKANAVFRGNLSVETRTSSSTKTLNFGYHSGGLNPVNPVISTVQRISYANDSSKSLIRGPLTLERWRFAGTGNNNFGYYGGGRYLSVARTTVDRINYSNDTETAIIRGSLPFKLSGLSATGNSDFGYFGGGSQLSGPALSTIFRIDYSNDKVDATPRSALSAAISYVSGLTNAINS